MIGTLVPAVQFAGLLTPVASLEGLGKLIGQVSPGHAHAHHQPWRLQQGAGPVQPAVSFWPLLAAIPVALGASALLLRKQER